MKPIAIGSLFHRWRPAAAGTLAIPAALFLTLTIGGCGTEEEPEGDAGIVEVEEDVGRSETQLVVPEDHEDEISGETSRIELDGLTFEVPAEWQEEAPSTSMRVAQFVLPGPEGTAAASLVVYYFDNGAGDVQANVDRWVNQMEQPDGSDSLSHADMQRRSVQGMAVTTVDVTGTYVAPVMPGQPGRHNEPDSRLFTAIAHTSDSPYYFKIVGPEATVNRWDEAIDQMIESFRPQ